MLLCVCIAATAIYVCMCMCMFVCFAIFMNGFLGFVRLFVRSFFVRFCLQKWLWNVSVKTKLERKTTKCSQTNPTTAIQHITITITTTTKNLIMLHRNI